MAFISKCDAEFKRLMEASKRGHNEIPDRDIIIGTTNIYEVGKNKGGGE
ncbi:MAG: hypothetical protein ACYTEQ_29875 [Planctomycetota bacterium]|jgi:hypothetical protein